jgi:hypothetical protein
MIFLSFPIEKTIIPYFSVPSLSHLTSCTPTKFNLYLANSLAAAISDPALYRLLTFHVPSNMYLFHLRLRDTSSRNTPSPEDPNGGVVYLRIVLSPEEASLMGNS